MLSGSCIFTALILLTLLYIPNQNALIVGFLMFFAGLCCGAYMLAYTISNELAPYYLQSAATGFTNTLAVLSAPLLQPFIGFLLDFFETPNIQSYQRALLVVPVALLFSSILVMLLPQKQLIRK